MATLALHLLARGFNWYFRLGPDAKKADDRKPTLALEHEQGPDEAGPRAAAVGQLDEALRNLQLRPQ